MLCIVLSVTIPIGSFASTPKDEVIYMNLDSSGALSKTYVVNVFNTDGEIEDYGNYDKVKNLTDMSKINIDNDKLTIKTKAKRFYYQGDLDSIQMPWRISIKYYLDGEQVEGSDLAGKSGQVKIIIDIKQNAEGDEDIYKNFSLQVSLGAYSDKISELKFEGSNAAYAGGKTTLNYIVLPKEEKTIELEFKANDLEMDPIRFVAVPFKLDFDFEMPEIEDPAKKVDELKNGVSDLTSASSRLKSGASDLSKGLSGLSKGSSKFNDAMGLLSSNADQLTSASGDILSGLVQLKNGLDSGNMGDLSEFQKLIDGSSKIDGAITQLLKGLNLYANAFKKFKSETNFSPLIAGNEQLKQALEQQLLVFEGIPDTALTPEQQATKAQLLAQVELINRTLIVLKYKDVANENKLMSETINGIITGLEQQLQNPNLPENVVNEINAKIVLLQKQAEIFMNNEKAILARDTFINTMESNIKPIIGGLTQLSQKYKKFDAGIKQIPVKMKKQLEGLKELKNAVSELVNGYSKFDDGLGEFIAGQSKLMANYSKIDNGIFESMKGANLLSTGANMMNSGMNTLDNGLSEFNITEIENKIKDAADKYKFEDYKIKSFVSDKNTDVKIQQFIIATPAIEKKVEKKAEEQKQENLSLWKKIKRVFGY